VCAFIQRAMVLVAMAVAMDKRGVGLRGLAREGGSAMMASSGSVLTRCG
jgi:hypothetical protein